METKKQIRVMAAIPYTKSVETDCWQSVLNMAPPYNVTVVINTFAKYSAGHARNTAARAAVEQGFDYILFTDSDQILPPDTLARLLALGCDMAAGWTMMNVNRPETNIASYSAERKTFDFYRVDNLPEAVFEPGGCGFAVNLLKVAALENLRYPYFVYTEYPGGDVLSEDLFFCLKFKEAGKKILCDPSLRAGHIKRIVI
jgi:cellulose synthase/poly-beta-1,6-N-acetylglucosamine synthase-like glycosyltransferase